MANKDLAIVVLAAGKGTRLKSNLAKVLHQAGGRTLVEQVLRACAPLGAKKTVVVIGHQAEQVQRWLSRRGEHGFAVSAARDRARDASGAACDRRGEDCGGVAGRRAADPNGDVEGAGCGASGGKCGGDDFVGGGERSFGLRADFAEVGDAGWRDCRRIAIGPGAARNQRDQFEHLLLHAG